MQRTSSMWIGATVRLKKRGRSYVGLCPFHQGEDSLLHHQSRKADVSLLRLQQEGERVYLCHGTG